MLDPLQRLFDEPPTPRWCRDATLRWWWASREEPANSGGQKQPSQGEEDARDPAIRTQRRRAGADAIRALLAGPPASLSASAGAAAAFLAPNDLARALNVATRFPDQHVARGMVVAVVVHAYLTWVVAECGRLNIRRVFFVSREGGTLARAFNALARAAHPTVSRATYLPASRLATFLPSLDALSPDSLARLWAQYPGQTLDQLLRNLALTRADFTSVASKHAIPLNTPINDLTRLRPFFDDPAVRHAFTTHRDRARAALAAYLSRKRFFDDRTIAIGDIGWKGSIQTNIEHALRAWHAEDASRPAPPLIHGLYLALRRDAALDTTPSTRAGFIADEPAPASPQSGGVRDWEAASIFRCGSMFEVALSVPHRCVAAYQASPHAPRSVLPRPQLLSNADPLFASLNACERDIFAGPARLTRIACLRTLRVMAANASHQGPIDVNIARPWLLDLLRREIVYPSRASADSFLDYAHVETFGVFQPSRFDFVTPWRDILRGPPIHWPHRVRIALQSHFWPDAIVRRSGIPLANLAFDLMLTRRARKA